MALSLSLRQIAAKRGVSTGCVRGVLARLTDGLHKQMDDPEARLDEIICPVCGSSLPSVLEGAAGDA